MRKPTPLAIICSDLHLSLLQPVCRADKDWKAVQAGYLRQVKEIGKNLPILCAGDIFDKWNPCPELIHFALTELPDGMICVPGQHDLPNHRIDQMKRSGYGVLVETGKIIDASSSIVVSEKGFAVYGFGWNEKIESLDPNNEQRPGAAKAIIHVALIHRYCWSDTKKYPGAPDEANVSAFRKELKGYDVAFFGDNHLHFTAQAGNCLVFNCGGFIRRKSDEIFRRPCIGRLMSDGTVERIKLDTSSDVFHDTPVEREETPLNMKEFIKGLEGLGEEGLDFKETVKAFLKKEKIDETTEEIILKAIENESHTSSKIRNSI